MNEVLHRNGRCSLGVNDAEASCSVVLNKDEPPVELPAAYSVEVLFRPAAYSVEVLFRPAAISPPRHAKLLWSLAGGEADAAQQIRLALEGWFMVVRRLEGAEWIESTRLPLSLGNWNWCGAVIDGASDAVARERDPP